LDPRAPAPLRHLVLLSSGRVAARPVGRPPERPGVPDRRLLPLAGLGVRLVGVLDERLRRRAPGAAAPVSALDRRERRPLPGGAVPRAGRPDQRGLLRVLTLRLLKPAASRIERPVSRRKRSAMPSSPPTVSSRSTRSTRLIG